MEDADAGTDVIIRTAAIRITANDAANHDCAEQKGQYRQQGGIVAWCCVVRIDGRPVNSVG
jgi:hypothetical protein